MTPETLIVKTTDDTFFTDLGTETKTRYPHCSWRIISTCPYRRSMLRRKYGAQRVVNPFSSPGEFYVDIIFVEDWPSLMGERFSEFNYLLFSGCKLLILCQKYRAPSWAYLKLLEFCPAPTFLLNEHVPALPLFPLIKIGRKKMLIKWSDQTLKKSHKIYRDTQIDFYVGLDIRVHSYFMNYAQSHAMIGMSSSGLRCSDWRSFVQLFVTYFKVHLRREWNSLVDYHYEYQNRGNTHSQNSLSRPSYYWNSLTAYGKKGIRSFLWRARWWQKT